jgi:hypothetical protein
MRSVDHRDIEQAVSEMVGVLGPHTSRDWGGPDAPPGSPVQVPLWSTGRTDLAGHPRVTSWVWKAALD